MEVAPDSDRIIPVGDDTQTEEQKRIFRTADRRFQFCVEAEATTRKYNIDDLKFVEADAYNGWQWPTDIYLDRNTLKKPSLTINKTRQHCLQITNDAKQNKASIKMRAVGGGASAEAAEMRQGIIRHIEYQSDASTVYDNAINFQVKIGIGWARVATDYADDAFDEQEIYIREINDPMCVYIDPAAKKLDKSDARFAFIYSEVPREEFLDIYPQYGSFVSQNPFTNADSWNTKDYIRIAEYFWTSEAEDRIIQYKDPKTKKLVIKKVSKIPEHLLKAVIDDPATKQRQVVNVQVNWCLIVGGKVVDGPKIWPGRYIPLAPCIGEETYIEGKIDRKGHVRSMIDAQRMYNYWASSAVEYGALQSKTPYIAPAAAIEGFQGYWDTANTENYSVLPYNHMDDDGQPIPPPTRQQPPVTAPMYTSGMQQALQEMMLVSGQHEANLGEQGNERSGAAIQQRQRKGDNATYHYIDNQATFIRAVGRIVNDLIPHIYDTHRVLMIQAEDGTDLELTIDPNLNQSHQIVLDEDNKVAQRIFNPNVGKYEVEVDVGPGYATKREEAVDAFTKIITQAPELTQLIGDILLRNADFPGAQEAAERLKRMLPAQALGQGPTKTETQLQEQLKMAMAELQKVSLKLQNAEEKLKSKDLLRDIDAYNAITKRLKESGAIISPLIGRQVLEDALGLDLEALLPHIDPNSDIASVMPGPQGGGPGQPQGPGQPPAQGQPPAPQQPQPQTQGAPQ